MGINTRLGTVILLIGCLPVIPVWGAGKPPAWQNPDVGLTVDATTEAHNAENTWKTPGMSLRAAELIVSGNIDPYAFLLGNIIISQQGAELHEAFAVFPTLPWNLKIKAGLMLANFGRWNRFHTHAMPFTSEPRIYREYADGMLALRGVEISWLVPIPHFLELTLSTFDLIDGHSHDTDPPDASNALTDDKVAAMLGAVPHGGHYDYQGRHIYDTGDLYALAGLPAPNDPEIFRGLRRIQDLAYGGRLATSLEVGSEFSADLGASALFQHHWKKSRRHERGFPEYYDKLLWGADLVLFWHPLSSNKYRNLQAGVEVLGTLESYEALEPSSRVTEAWRTGVFTHIDYKHNRRWHVGAFSSIFQSNNPQKDNRMHTGGYLTFAITHYQYLRMEYSRYDYPEFLDGVDRIRLQYDAAIGYHSHGSQR